MQKINSQDEFNQAVKRLAAGPYIGVGGLNLDSFIRMIKDCDQENLNFFVSEYDKIKGVTPAKEVVQMALNRETGFKDEIKATKDPAIVNAAKNLAIATDNKAMKTIMGVSTEVTKDSGNTPSPKK